MWTRRTALRAVGVMLLGRVGMGSAADRQQGALATPAAAYCPSSQERAFLNLINAYRKKNGKGTLTLSVPLGAAAEFHSRDLARRKRIKGHSLTTGVSALQNMRNFGFTGRTWGENIAWEAPDAQTVFNWWKKSPEHNRNMLDGRFRSIGIGLYYDPNSRFHYYWTTDFGDDGGAVPGC